MHFSTNNDIVIAKKKRILADYCEKKVMTMIPYYEIRETPLSIMPLFYPFFIQPHLHNQVELIYCADGAITMTVDGTSRILRRGDIGMAFPGANHSYGTLENPPCNGVILLFEPSFIPDHEYALNHKKPNKPFVSIDDSHQDVRYVLAALTNEWDNARDQVVLRALITLLFSRLISKSDLYEQDTPMPESALHKAMLFIAHHYTESLNLKLVARHVGVSPFHLSHLMTAHLKVGFCAYVNSLRLNKAEMLIKNTGMPITQICFDAGFDSQRTFNRVFYERYGISPREMRKR